MPREIARREALVEKRSRGGAVPPEDGQGPAAEASDQPQPKDTQQIDLTDPDSALMRESRRDGCEQAYHANVVVDVGDRRLILGTVQRVVAD